MPISTWWEISQTPEYRAWAHPPQADHTDRLLRALDALERSGRPTPLDGRLSAQVQGDGRDQVGQHCSPLVISE